MLCDGPPRYRVTEIRGDLGKGHEHAGALEHPRMRYGQLGSGDAQLIIQEDIQINDPRAITDCWHAPQLSFGGLEQGQKVFGGKVCLHGADGVEETGLLGDPPRLRLIKTREGTKHEAFSL
jgi:hypothetical protein